MSENMHAGNAALIVQRVVEADDWYADKPEALGRAQIQATLALAYEQRTANLIALLTDGNEAPIPSVDYGDLIEQIKERLDLP